MRRRLLISTVGIAVVVALLLGLPMAILLDRLAYASARAQAERQAVSIGLALEPALISGRVPTPALLEAIVADREQLTLVTAEGRRITGGEAPGPAITVAAPGPAGTQLVLSTPDEEVRDELRRSWLVLTAVALLGVAAAVAMALVQSRQLSWPLVRLRRQAERIGAGDFTATAPRSGLVEVDAIATALDDASARIAGLVAAEQAFSANASHQLRTALTGLVLRLDLLTEHEDPTVREEADAALQQADRLRRTVEDLLQLARTGRVGDRRSIDLHRLAREHVEDWSGRLRLEGRAVELSGTSPVPALVSPGGIGEAVDVLVDNARVHGAGTVSVHVRSVDEHAELLVADEGPGIGDGEDVFRREADGEGHGLGLSLARTLVEADGGALEVVRRRPAQFRIRLPASARADA